MKQLRPSKSHASLTPTSEIMKGKTRACDACRTKKSRCDGPLMPDGVCSRCTKARKPCTYLNSSVPRGPPKAYVTALEDRLENIESLIRRLRPDIDLVEHIGPSIPRDSWKDASEIAVGKRPSKSSSVIPLRSIHSTPDLRDPLSGVLLGPHYMIHSRNDPESDSDDDAESALSDTEEALGDFLDVQHRKTSGMCKPLVDIPFMGNSAGSTLLGKTRRLKRMRLGSPHEQDEKHPFSNPSTSSHPTANRRPIFWTQPPWELLWVFRGTDRMIPWLLGHFPPEPLCRELIDLYFTRINIFYPVLHRPSFERHWLDRLHEADSWFAGICLSVFALASRFSDDRDVLPTLEHSKSKPNWQQAGVAYAQAVTELHMNYGSLLTPACLFEVQTLPLIALYFRGSAQFSISWMLIAMASLKSFDVGVHSRKRYRDQSRLDQELWKRTFFVLYVMDRIYSTDVGRQYLIREEDFDIERPLLIDDEYLENEHPNYLSQPPDKPSTMEFFGQLLQLCGIMAASVEFLYNTKRENKVSMQDKETLAVLKRTNEALACWLDGVPDHLKWSKQASSNDPTFSNQSYMLYLTYTGIQTLLYRPFVTMDELLPSSTPPQERPPFAARALCITSARTFARLITEQWSRGIYNIWATMSSAYIGSALLLVCVWQLRRARSKSRKGGALAEVQALNERIDSFMHDIERLISCLEFFEPRWEVISLYLSKLKSSLPPPSDDSEPAREVKSGKYPRASPFLPPSPADSLDSDKSQRDTVIPPRTSNPVMGGQVASHLPPHREMESGAQSLPPVSQIPERFHRVSIPQQQVATQYTTQMPSSTPGGGHTAISGPPYSFQQGYPTDTHWNHPLHIGSDPWYNAVPAQPTFQNFQPSYFPSEFETPSTQVPYSPY